MNVEAAKQVCRSLPGCAEDIKWGNNLVFTVGARMFAITSVEQPAQAMSFKVEDHRFLELTDRPGIVAAPYLARARWVQVQLAAKLSDSEAAALVRRSYELVFAKLTRKVQNEITGAAWARAPAAPTAVSTAVPTAV